METIKNILMRTLSRTLAASCPFVNTIGLLSVHPVCPSLVCEPGPPFILSAGIDRPARVYRRWRRHLALWIYVIPPRAQGFDLGISGGGGHSKSERSSVDSRFYFMTWLQFVFDHSDKVHSVLLFKLDSLRKHTRSEANFSHLDKDVNVTFME